MLSVDENSLSAAVKDFERLIKSSERPFMGDSRLTHALCVFYAMRAAFAIRAILDYDARERLLGIDSSSANYPTVLRETALPRLDIVHNAVQTLHAAATSHDRAGTVSALRDMGVLALCPMPEQQLSRMELVAENVVGRPRLIFLVELSVFAAELEDYRRAGRYALESRALNPSSCELYNLCIVEGLVALSAGQTREAVQHLDKSLTACQADEFASLSCGVRAPNLSLAEKLLEIGERIEVLRHLSECRDVWQLLPRPIDKWISVIEGGGIPKLQTSRSIRALSQPSQKLAMQTVRAHFLDNEADLTKQRSDVPMSRAEVLARREKLKAEYNRHRDTPTDDRNGPSES